MSQISKIVIAVGLFFSTIPAWATTAMIIDSNSLNKYDIESADVPSGKIAKCADWTYDANQGFTSMDPNDQNYYSTLSYTTMTATLTPAGATSPIVVSFSPACDASNQPTGVFNSDLYNLSQTLADIKLGNNPTQNCTKTLTCADANGTGPCQTTYGTQTGTVRLIVQVSSDNMVIDYQQSTVWGTCQ